MKPFFSPEIAAVRPELVHGAAEILNFDPNKLVGPTREHQPPQILAAEDMGANSPFVGMRYHGYYDTGTPGPDGLTTQYNVVSGLYHKLGKDGKLETLERLMIVIGIGYGTHGKDHFHQRPGTFLLAAQIGLFNPQTSEITDEPGVGEIEFKYFSSECFDRRQTIPDAPTPVLANPYADRRLYELLERAQPDGLLSDEQLAIHALASRVLIRMLLERPYEETLDFTTDDFIAIATQQFLAGRHLGRA